MRLSPNAAKVIHDAVHAHFGKDAEVWLFGSRVDDSRKGGDIDLYVETDEMDAGVISKQRSKFLAALYIHLGEQKIDVLVKSRRKATALTIHTIAREEGVRL